MSASFDDFWSKSPLKYRMKCMNWLSRQSIRAQLSILVASCILPALIIILYSGIERSRHATHDAERNAQKLAHGIAAHQESAVESARQQLITLSMVPEVRHPSGACSRFLRELLEIKPMYANLTVAAPDGTVMASARPMDACNISEREYFRRVMTRGEFVVGDYIICNTVKRPVQRCAYPVMSGGAVRSVLVAAIDMTYVAPLFRQVNLPDGSMFALTDYKGVRIYRYPDSEKYEGRHDLDYIMKTMSEGPAEGSFIVKGADGVLRLYAYLRFYLPGKTEPLYIRVGIPESKALYESRSLLFKNLALIGFAAIVALLLANKLGISAIVKPLERLSAASRRVGRGDLSARAEISYNRGEVGRLARAFDEMAGELADKELARANYERLLRESGERYRSLVENINEVLFTLDNDGRITYLSPSASKGTRYTLQEMEGRLFSDFVHPEDLPGLAQSFEKTLAGDLEPHEFRVIDRDGSVIHVLTSSRPLIQNGKTVGVTGLLSDITERKRNEEKLQASLREKETLLREIHHRVKNNLQVVSSFLHLQSRGVNDPNIFKLFQNSQGRIRSMALIHEQLYRSDSFSDIDFGRYIEGLVRYLHGVYQSRELLITPTVRSETIHLSIDRAIPCGLLLNEVISNSFKHAFIGRERGEISVDFRRLNGHYELAVRDDGVGLPSGTVKMDPSTLGFQIITSLVEQIGGNMEIQTDSGLGVVITFPVADPYRSRV